MKVPFSSLIILGKTKVWVQGYFQAQISSHIFCFLPFVYLLLFLGGPEKNHSDQDN